MTYETPEDHAAAQRAQGLGTAVDEEVETDRKLPTTPEEWFRFRNHLRNALRTGSRRREYLVRITRDPGARPPNARSFDLAELSFVETALLALRWVRERGERMEKAEALLRRFATACDDETGLLSGEFCDIAVDARDLLEPR
jgi:hypothetical protein